MLTLISLGIVIIVPALLILAIIIRMAISLTLWSDSDKTTIFYCWFWAMVFSYMGIFVKLLTMLP